MKIISAIVWMTLLFVMSTALPDVAAVSILEEVRERGLIRIGSGAADPPLHYIDRDGNRAGFEIDLGDVLAKRLGVQAERVPAPNRTAVCTVSGNIERHGTIPRSHT